MWRWLRRRSAEVGWRAAVDSLRPHSQSCGRASTARSSSASCVMRGRGGTFIGTASRPKSLPPSRGWSREGRLQIVAGRILSMPSSGTALEVELRRRGAGAAADDRFAYAFNCTGPLHAIGRTRDPLLRSFSIDGEVAPDQLGIGLEVDENSRRGGTHCGRWGR